MKTMSKSPTDDLQQIMVTPIWNPIVANYTLQAIGTSLPLLMIMLFEPLLTSGREDNMVGVPACIGTVGWSSFGGFVFAFIGVMQGKRMKFTNSSFSCNDVLANLGIVVCLLHVFIALRITS